MRPLAGRNSAGLGWPEKEQDAFIRMQFDAQTRHYRESFPNATYSLIRVDGEPAGRLIVNRADNAIVIVDITLAPKFRRIGIGGGLVRRLLDEADADRLRVRCHVLKNSDARRFWERAGFVAQADDGMYAAMERAPRPRHSDRGGAVRPCSSQHGPGCGVHLDSACVSTPSTGASSGGRRSRRRCGGKDRTSLPGWIGRPVLVVNTR